MRLVDRRVLLTGASGGIGHELAIALAAEGAQLLLSGRSVAALSGVAATIAASGGVASVLPVDLLQPNAAQDLVARANGDGLGFDVLINCAGVSHFGAFESLSAGDLERLWHTNVLGPMLLTQAALPVLKARAPALIVNVGSIFGSIAFPWFTAYSASKFALRGFSEALRRELDGTGVEVLYVAPRYTRTRINAGAVGRMAAAVEMKQDEPAWVAGRIVRAMAEGDRDRYLGWPESFFVRLNALLPRLVDGSLKQQTERMRPFALSKE